VRETKVDVHMYYVLLLIIEQLVFLNNNKAILDLFQLVQIGYQNWTLSPGK